MGKIYDRITTHFARIADWTSIRVVYLLMAAVLLLGVLLQSWAIVEFVIIMLTVGVSTRFCPSKWIAEKLGFKKVEL